MVPTTAHVRPGAAVSIVLKQDQRTGREVSGLVQDLLTRGNHPRGIKVRLQDGRIGRVQRMLSTETVEPTSASTLQKDLQEQSIARGGGGADAPGSAGRRAYRSETLGVRYTDVRNEDDGEAPPTERDLMDYVKPVKPRKIKKGKNQGNGEAEATTATVAAAQSREFPSSASVSITCPVCDEFQGDETAVARHVESHFS